MNSKLFNHLEEKKYTDYRLKKKVLIFNMLSLFFITFFIVTLLTVGIWGHSQIITKMTFIILILFAVICKYIASIYSNLVYLSSKYKEVAVHTFDSNYRVKENFSSIGGIYKKYRYIIITDLEYEKNKMKYMDEDLIVILSQRNFKKHGELFIYRLNNVYYKFNHENLGKYYPTILTQFNVTMVRYHHKIISSILKMELQNFTFNNHTN